MQRYIEYRIWDGRKFYYADIYEIAQGYPMSDASCMVKDLVFQQYTGLRDRNKVKIYEGDILNEYYSSFEGFSGRGTVFFRKLYPSGPNNPELTLVSEVYWSDSWKCFHLKRKDKLTGREETSHSFPFHSDHIEVVGNIFN